jgi:hypothetical protein
MFGSAFSGFDMQEKETGHMIVLFLGSGVGELAKAASSARQGCSRTSAWLRCFLPSCSSAFFPLDVYHGCKQS